MRTDTSPFWQRVSTVLNFPAPSIEVTANNDSIANQFEKKLEDEYAEGNLLLGNFIVAILAIDCLLIYVRYVNETHMMSTIIQNVTSSFETSRVSQQILTDDMDCSLLIKEASLAKFTIQNQMLFGITCLTLLVPYSVTPTSSLSTMVYYMQKREALAESFKFGYITKECSVANPPASCHIRSHYKYMMSHVDLINGLKKSSLGNIWKSASLDRTEVMEWLYQSRTSSRTTSKNVSIDENLLLRKFRIPRAFKRATVYYNMSTNSINADTSKITITEPIANQLIDDILSSTARTSSASTSSAYDYKYCSLPLLPYTKQQKYELRFPCRDNQPTSSIISSFIIRVVREIMMRSDFQRGYMDANFHALLLRAHRYAELMIANDEAIVLDSSLKLPKLLSDSTISKAVESIINNEEFSVRIKRHVYERVATGIIWRSKKYDMILMINLGLNHTNEVNNLLSSAAGVMVVDKLAQDNPIIVASASGSIRTVEAVSTVVLRMLMFDDEPGAAIDADASFYNVEDSEYYCENNKKQFIKEMEKYGIRCLPINHNNFTHIDRIAMAVRKRHRKNRLIAAIDRRAIDFNYAVGL
ncbi:hypothetical protein DICVIV_13343 [Dictyocaulus viviparus]|uniref:Uncharacterized protein n=1 Tax=Dictyocaulus viviparus TaxID=29172 RepID=A0A0D8X818_DICVI|nr:hypothetical protein DICVIV_13343 [Dictyocaulus viviparus]